MTNEEKIIQNSSIMIERNLYNQNLRTYALTPYDDDKYYSNCSSFVCAAYKAGGFDVGWMNLYELRNTDKFYDVQIDYNDNGVHIKDAANVLHIADVIIWNGYIEMVHSIENGIVYVQGHNSDRPKIQKLYDVEKLNNGKSIVRRMRFKEDNNDNGTNISSSFKVIYFVQCGVFKSKDNAICLQKELLKKGFTGFVYNEHDGYYRVQVGTFSLKENADKYSEKIKEAGFDSAYVRVK